MKWTPSRRVRIAVGAAVVVAAVGASLLAGCLWWAVLFYRVIFDIPFKKAECEKVVADIHAGKLSPNPHGVLVLPPKRAHLAVGGTVYVTHASDGNTLILFPMWVGKAMNVRGYVHSSKPWPSPMPPLELVRFSPGAPPWVGKSRVWVDRRVDAHWCYVSDTMA